MINPKGWQKIEAAILADLNNVASTSPIIKYKEGHAFGLYVRVVTLHINDDKVSITTKYWDRSKDMEKLGNLFSSEPYEQMKDYASISVDTRQLSEDERLAFFEVYLDISLPLPSGPGMYLLDGDDSEISFFTDVGRTVLSFSWGGGLPQQYTALQPLLDILVPQAQLP